MIGRAQRFDVSQHHCRRVVSNGDLDLRNGLARLEICDHRGERRQFVGERLLQHTARFQPCHAVAEALAETDQQLAGITHGANGETRAPPVVVQRTAHRRECRLRDHTGCFELIEQPSLLQRELPVRGEVLHAAATAAHERFARRFRVRADRHQPFFRQRIPIAAAPSHHPRADHFSWQRALHVHRMTLELRHTETVGAERLDFEVDDAGSLSLAHSRIPKRRDDALFRRSR